MCHTHVWENRNHNTRQRTKPIYLIFASAVIWYPRTQNLSNDVFYNQSISINAYIFKLELSTTLQLILTPDGFIPSECTRSHTYLYGVGVYSLSRQYVERREIQAAREDPVGTRCSSAKEKKMKEGTMRGWKLHQHTHNRTINRVYGPKIVRWKLK